MEKKIKPIQWLDVPWNRTIFSFMEKGPECDYYTLIWHDMCRGFVEAELIPRLSDWLTNRFNQCELAVQLTDHILPIQRDCHSSDEPNSNRRSTDWTGTLLIRQAHYWRSHHANKSFDTIRYVTAQYNETFVTHSSPRAQSTMIVSDNVGGSI